MNEKLKVFGALCGLISFFACLIGGIVVMGQGDGSGGFGLGLFFIGIGFFAGPLLMLVSIRDGAAGQVVEHSRGNEAVVQMPDVGSIAKAVKTVAGPNSSRIYVGNLADDVDEDKVRSEFEECGTVKNVSIIVDRSSGKSKGYGFVEMDDATEAAKAILALDGKEIGGQAIKVNEAKSRGPRRGRRGGGRYGGSSRGQRGDKDQSGDSSSDYSEDDSGDDEGQSRVESIFD
jgi:hypothetical protein